MQDLAHVALSPWDTFYVIVGSSGAALTGLQFVVIALVADSRRQVATMDTVDTFSSPAVAHFGVVLLIAAVLTAPWHALSSVAIVLGIIGAVGLGYVGLVIRRVFRQTLYSMVFEDWLWHVALPFASYALLVAGAIVLPRDATSALFMVAAMTVALLFIGIHIAWDTATYLVAQEAKRADAPKEATSTS